MLYIHALTKSQADIVYKKRDWKSSVSRELNQKNIPVRFIFVSQQTKNATFYDLSPLIGQYRIIVKPTAGEKKLSIVSAEPGDLLLQMVPVRANPLAELNKYAEALKAIAYGFDLAALMLIQTSKS